MKILGDWLLWEEGTVARTIDTNDISYASFCPTADTAFSRNARAVIVLYGHDMTSYHLDGEDAERFWEWWMKRLEEKEAFAVQLRVMGAELVAKWATPPQGT